MRLASPLFVPPVVFLALISTAYALVPWVCETQRRLPLHMLSLAALVVVIGCVHRAWRNWRSLGGDPVYDEPDVTARQRLIAAIGLVVSALVAVGTLMVWVTQVVVPPCVR